MNDKRTLYDISDDLWAIEAMLEETGEIVDGYIEEWLERVGDQRDMKVDSYCGLISELDARAERLRAEAKRLSEWARVEENKRDKLKERLKWFFEAHGIQRLVTAHFKPRIQANGGVLPLVLDEPDPLKLPEEFQKVRIEPDTEIIRSVLDSGDELPFAHYGPRGAHLRIK